MKEPLYNQRFEDIYFSPEDGLAETRHVFLAGNDLPARWAGRQHFTIAETGFGTGLNFLAAWKLFDETAEAQARLDFVSFELYPLRAEVIAGALARWRDEFDGRLERMLALYPLRVAGFHRLQLSPRVSLTLVFDDVNAALPELVVPRGVDAWFLDGFAPAKNPEMWTDALFQNMARLSAAGASAATFTAAGAVRRGLAAQGFEVAKARGYGRKRDMTKARFAGEGPEVPAESDAKRIAVVGAGLAGAACIYALRQAGHNPVLFEEQDQIAAGASGNDLGLFNPRFTAQRGAESDFYAAAFAQARGVLQDLSHDHDIGYRACGTMHLVNSPEKEKRFRSLCGSWGWDADHLRYLDAGEASALAGADLHHDALYLPDAGQVSPARLCAAYVSGADVRTGVAVHNLLREADGWRIGGEFFDYVILANGWRAKDYAELSWLPLHTVRGQVSAVKAGADSARLRCNVCYGGYISAPDDGMHMVGATFQRWLDDTDVKDADHAENLAKLAEVLPDVAQGLSVSGGRAGLRTVTADHLPVIGRACDQEARALPGLYISTGHGSHGILSSLAGARLIADMILGVPYSLPQRSAEMPDGARFIRRARKRGGWT